MLTTNCRYLFTCGVSERSKPPGMLVLLHLQSGRSHVSASPSTGHLGAVCASLLGSILETNANMRTNRVNLSMVRRKNNAKPVDRENGRIYDDAK